MTPLLAPAYYLASNGRLMKAAGDVDCTGKKLEIYTTDELCAYGAAEYRRALTDAAEACRAWAKDHALVDGCTYETCDFVAAAHDCADAILKLGEAK